MKRRYEIAGLAGLVACRFGGPTANPAAYVAFPDAAGNGGVGAASVADDGGSPASPVDATTVPSGGDTNGDDAPGGDASADDAPNGETTDGGACSGTVAVCNPVRNTGCNALQQCDVDPSQATTPTGLCVFGSAAEGRSVSVHDLHGELPTPVHVRQRRMQGALLLRRRLSGRAMLLGSLRSARLHSLPALPMTAAGHLGTHVAFGVPSGGGHRMSVSTVMVRRPSRRGGDGRAFTRDELLRPQNIDPARLAEVDGRFELEEFGRLQMRAMDLTRDEALGLHIAEHTHDSAFDLIAHLVSHAPTLREAFGVCAQFQRLIIDDSQITLSETGTTAKLQYQLPPHLRALGSNARPSSSSRPSCASSGSSRAPA